MTSNPLSPEEQSAAVSEYDRLAKVKVPGNLRTAGCSLTAVGGIMLIALPVFLSDASVEAGAKKVMIVFVIALVVGGVWLAVRGNRMRRFVRNQAAAALEELKRFPVLTPTERTTAAVRLLFYAPGARLDEHPERLRTELPDALPYVLQVEDLLVAEQRTALRLRGLR